MKKDQLITDLIRDEGERLKPYRDSVGKLSIGVGRNLDDVGISATESRLLLNNDVVRVGLELDKHIPWWRNLDDDRQNVLANMCFNLGIFGLLKFPRFLSALQGNDYATAATEMLNSLWAKQVGARATRLAAVMRGE